ncbi:hypothetical protein GCM10022225_38310 [Plantactinospora mayteni]|uniref:HNH endonuclease n=1 Tax=Plantactinospora mayteni TaxID=566021 RepID=A0ABQ4EWV0_9ACTN|nr:hypothetical protein [Plantactinospora mayteni]GIG99149.1 hypothetical protein Pma05_57220 [Plantactinospora mayteni]
MFASPGDIVYACIGNKPERRFLGFRFRVTAEHLVLVLPWAINDDQGNERYGVLPLHQDITGTRIDPNNLRWVPRADVGQRRDAMDRQMFQVVCGVLEGDDPRHPEIRLPDAVASFLQGESVTFPWLVPGPDQDDEQRYPTIAQAMVDPPELDY